MNAQSFRFALADRVAIKDSIDARGFGGAQSGEVIGRADYSYKSNDYLVRHCDAAGDLVERWYSEETLEAPSD